MLVQCWPTVYDVDTALGQCPGFTIVTVWISSKHDMPTQCWIDVVDGGSPLSLQLVLLSGVLAVWPSCDCWASSWSCCLVYWRHGRDVIVEPPVGPAVWCIGGMAVMWLLSLQLVLLSGVLAVWPSCDCWASSCSCCLVYWRYGRHVIVEPPVGPAVWCTGGMAVMWLLSLQLVLLSGVLAVRPWWDCCIKWKWVSEGIVLSPSTAGTDYIRFFYIFINILRISFQTSWRYKVT